MAKIFLGKLSEKTGNFLFKLTAYPKAIPFASYQLFAVPHLASYQ